MDNRPMVSVITIFLNGGEFMEQAIESVLAQSHANWELLLIDDGSTDSSSALARGYARRHPDRIRYLEHPGHANRGMSASRNLGLGQARGRYVALLDADDVWLPNKLAEQVPILEALPQVGMLYGRSLYWHSWTPGDERDWLMELGVPANQVLSPPALVVPFLRRLAPVPCPCSVLLRRSALEAVGGWEDQFRGMYEDQALYVKLCLNWPVYAADACWDRYRRHAQSCNMAAKASGRAAAARLRFLTWVERYLASQGSIDPEVWKAVRDELWPLRYPIFYRLWRQVRHASGQMMPDPVRRWLKARLALTES